MQNFVSCARTFIPAVLRQNKEWYIEFSYCSKSGEMKRARKYLNCALKRISGMKARREYATHELNVINQKLLNGWTPEVDKQAFSNPKSVTPWRVVFVRYRRYIAELEEKGDLRHAGALTYLSTLGILEDWIKCAPVPGKRERKRKQERETERLANGNDNENDNDNDNDNENQLLTPNSSLLTKERIAYIYELDEEAVKAWLIWGREEREAGQTTLKNYKRWLSSFCTWCMERGYMSENPASDTAIPTLGQKQRNEKEHLQSVYIDPATRQRIFAYFEANNRHMLLASYFCYYLLIRPKEMMQMRVGYFHVKDSLVFIPKSISKTEKDAWVTLPDCVTKLMLELGTLNHPSDWLVFDHTLNPAPPHTHINIGDALRDRWADMREDLNLPKRIWFYHLKHTGITDMVFKLAPRQVQLQARHSSLAMTERYMRDAPPKANAAIKNLE